MNEEAIISSRLFPRPRADFLSELSLLELKSPSATWTFVSTDISLKYVPLVRSVISEGRDQNYSIIHAI